MKLAALLFLPLFIPIASMATDLKPWLGSEYEAELRVTTLYQNYSSLATEVNNKCKRNENDTFTTLSAIYPFKRYSGEFEVTGAHTHHQSHCIDNVRVTGRYQWFNECEGPLSLITSITIGEPLSRALHDFSSFHHGHLETEVCMSVGQEYGNSYIKDFDFRWWSVLGVGVAETGSAWYRGDAAFEYNYNFVHLFRGFVNTLWGTGGKALRPNFFKGYGKIQHRSVDVGLRYGFIINGFGTLNIQYARRVYAHNFPLKANLFLFEYEFFFGSQTRFSY